MLLISVAKIGVFDFPFVWMIFWDDRCSMHSWFVSLSSGSARTRFFYQMADHSPGVHLNIKKTANECSAASR